MDRLKKMNIVTKKILIFFAKIIDIVLSPITFISSIWLLFIRKLGIRRMELSKYIFKSVGVLPINDHYYEPLIANSKNISKEYDNARNLPGIDFNIEKQLEILNSFNFQNELKNFSKNEKNGIDFFYNNPSFGPGDFEYTYSLIRKIKPQKIIEVGSGYSTRIILNAMEMNNKNNYSCELTCIEPYEKHLIKNLPVEIFEKKIEDVDVNYFKKLDKNDILFIDSSHIIRPEGDVVYEILNILPELNHGVIIHFHDIFTPYNYPKRWISNFVLWNEQYLLESFLTENSKFEIIGSLNFLKQNFWKEFSSKFPIISKNENSIPGSFWIRKI